MTDWIRDFQRRFKKRFGRNMKYEWVDELGEKNGRLHIHMLIHDCPYLRNEVWDELWKKGQVYAMTPFDDGAGGYMAKYIGKDRSHLLSGMRSYSTSRNLIRPEVMLQEWLIKRVLKELVDAGYTIRELGESSSDYRGKVLYELWLPPPKLKETAP